MTASGQGLLVMTDQSRSEDAGYYHLNTEIQFYSILHDRELMSLIPLRRVM